MTLGDEETQPLGRGAHSCPEGPASGSGGTLPSFSRCKGGEGELHFQICKMLLMSPYHKVEVSRLLAFLPEKLTCCVEELFVGGEGGVSKRHKAVISFFPF